MSKFERWIKNIAQAGIVVITLEKLFDFIAYIKEIIYAKVRFLLHLRNTLTSC